MTSLREINEYLFFEFGYESDESQVSEHWPFQLRPYGVLLEPEGESNVYSFNDGEEAFYVIDGCRTLYFLPSADMDLEALQTELEGRRWIGRADPVDLNTSLGSDSGVPTMLQRRKALEELAETALQAEQRVEILEGLYLRARSAYLGLFRCEEAAYMCMEGIAAEPAGFPQASPHRRLSHCIGRLLRRGTLQ